MNWKKYVFATFSLGSQLMGFDTTDMYLKADLGHSFSDTSYEVFDLGMGYHWTENWRSEFIWSIRPAAETAIKDDFGTKVPKRRFDNMTFMLSINYDFDDFDQFVPYVGLGVGAFKNKPKNLQWNESTVVYEASFAKFGLSGSLQLGVMYQLGRMWSIDFSYRAITLGDSKMKRLYVSDGIVYDSHTSHILVGSELTLGVIFHL